jgi:hypothetical protein
VIIQGAFCNACFGGDLIHADPRVSVTKEQTVARLKDAFLCFTRVAGHECECILRSVYKATGVARMMGANVQWSRCND